jgi:hypothetical protein
MYVYVHVCIMYIYIYIYIYIYYILLHVVTQRITRKSINAYANMHMSACLCTYAHVRRHWRAFRWRQEYLATHLNQMPGPNCVLASQQQPPQAQQDDVQPLWEEAVSGELSPVASLQDQTVAAGTDAAGRTSPLLQMTFFPAQPQQQQ